MMFLLALCFLLTLFPAINVAQNCTSDQQNLIKTCYLNYMKTYGFSVIPVYDLYSAALDKYRIKGWNGELYICMAGKTLFNCIGENNDGCVNVDVFTKISGLSNDNAFQYVTDYRLMKYRCLGDGFTEFKDTYKCMQQMQDCPLNPQTCDEIIPYLQCLEIMAYGFCGGEGSDYICNVMEITADVYLHCNNLPQCSKNNQTQLFEINKIFQFQSLKLN